MREILFKAKRIDNVEWIEGFFIKAGDKAFIVNHAELRYYEVDPSTLCQYTGKTDCNDKNVLENDILQVSDEDNFIYRVFWDSEDCMFKLECYDHICTFADLWMGDLEVIGNVFDNPELLEGSVE